VDARQTPTFWQLLPSEDREVLLQRAGQVRARRGQTVLRAGDDVVAMLLGGAATTRITTPDGEHAVHSILEAGSTWGLAGTLADQGANADVIALCDLEALIFPGVEIRRLVPLRPGIAVACLMTVALALTHVRTEAADFAGISTSERIAYRLVELAQTWGVGDDSHVRVDLPLTQEDLASWSHCSKEAATKALRRLRCAGLIETGRREFTILDLPKLEAQLPRRRLRGYTRGEAFHPPGR
jgi:CRP/FNR family transcriptional regulator, cyclic AMP receptor protein